MLIITSRHTPGKRLQRRLKGSLIVTKRRALKALRSLKTADIVIMDRLAWSWLSTVLQRQLMRDYRVLIICC